MRPAQIVINQPGIWAKARSECNVRVDGFQFNIMFCTFIQIRAAPLSLPRVLVLYYGLMMNIKQAMMTK